MSDSLCPGSGFNGSASVIVNPLPTAVIPIGDTSFCFGNIAQLPVSFTGTGPWDYTYEIENLMTSSVNNLTSSPNIFNAYQTGIYKILSLSDAYCTNTNLTDSTKITLFPLPDVNLGNDRGFCDNNGVLLDPGAGFATYLWSDSSTGQNLFTNVAGIYSVAVADTNGCTNSDSVAITVHPVRLVNIGADQEICEDFSLVLNAGAGFANYLWNDSSTGQNRIANVTGIYSVVVADTNGCTNSDSVSVTVYPAPISDFSFISDSLEGSFNNNSVNASSFIWDFGDSDTSTETNPYHIYQQPGTYVVTLIASNEYCTDNIYSDTISVFMLSNSIIVPQNVVKIYPNPTSGKINLEINCPGIHQVQVDIFSINGKIIITKEFSSEHIVDYVDLSPYSSGIYFVRMMYDNQIIITKLILEK